VGVLVREVVRQVMRVWKGLVVVVIRSWLRSEFWCGVDRNSGKEY
jgi:hypothetical protein